MDSGTITGISLGSAIIIGVAYLARSIVKQVLDKDLENYKTKITAEADKIQFEHQVRFSKLHEKRGEVIAELYKKLIEANRAAASFASPAEWVGEPSKVEKAQIAGKKIYDFYNYYNERKIYLSKELTIKIESLHTELMNSTDELAFFFQYKDLGRDMELRKLKIWNETFKKISKGEIKGALDALDDEFRKMLGVE